MKYDIYYSTTRKNKKYLVFYQLNLSIYWMLTDAKRFFRASENNIKVQDGWLIGDDLFFEEPEKRAKRVIVMSYEKDGGGLKL
jgi:hypothetical protein